MHKASLMENDAKDHIELIRTGGQTLKIYTVQSKNSMHAQSQVVEEALKEFFKRHKVKIDDDHLSELDGGIIDGST